MKKSYSPISYNSGTSSETSETQSVEENNTSGLGTPDTEVSRSTISSRTAKVWKRMKESNSEKEVAEAKRPPWRAVSVSTLPKPDKNALLRAKLLDASRRLRAGKSSIAVQTDIVPTKLMKEVNLGVQVDLIHLKDVCILTDGSFTMKKEGPGDFILTYSVSQMTDSIPVTSASTQTLLPRVPGDGFMKAYFTYDQNKVNLSEFSAVEQKLLQQIRSIREGKALNMVTNPNNHNDNCISEDSLSGTDTDTTDTKTTIEEATVPTYPRRSFFKPTYSSWFFNYDDDIEYGKSFQPYTIMRARPWSNYEGNASDRRVIKNNLDLNTDRGHPQEYQEININAFTLNAIDELILESNNLVDSIEDLCLNRELYKKRSIHEVDTIRAYKQTIPIFPSEHWLPIIEKQEKDLAKTKKSLTYPSIRKVNKLDLQVESND